MLNWNNLDTLASYQELEKAERINLAEVMSGENGAERVKTYSTPIVDGLTFNYAAKAVDDNVLAILDKLAKEAQLVEKYESLYNGAVINTGEKRLVLHQLTRGQLGGKVEADGVDKREFYVTQQKRIAEFANQVHAGEITNAAGEKFTTVVQIGIGGSDLGPRAMYLAMENWAKKNGAFKIEAKFISNVDPDDAAAVLNSIDVEHSLFVLVSKSGTTLETLTNESFVKDALAKAGLDASKHMIAVTSETSPLAKSDDYLAAFFMDDFIGGRYSSTSAVGGAVLSLAFGPEVFAQFLEGAAEVDRRATNKNLLENPEMLDALIGVYERNVLGYPATAVLPYSQALSRFPAHLQQMDMESNGKSVNRFGEPIDYVTGPLSPEPTDSIPSISCCIREPISFRCSLSDLRTARSARTLSFRAAPASRSCAQTWLHRSLHLPAVRQMITAIRISKADVLPGLSSATGGPLRLWVHCLHILRIRLCSRALHGM